ncbi:unnamed protein product [Rotaria socialis]|uniref:Nuclear condensin complex subunit 3 C-terminal domain-containing protein n=1 Tax=Rotaria socialis TaxID=392032 RepID=A0A820F186_9BILA|nr:unnamed protein product [Rotaria socialis]CAF4255727.1 unnamed protein product [Rotaria socialis]
MEKTIRTILDQAQNNNIRHGEHLKALADLYTKCNQESFHDEFLRCIASIITSPSNSTYVGHALHFISSFLTLEIGSSTNNDESPNNDSMQSDVFHPILPQVIQFFDEHKNHSSDYVRANICVLIGQILEKMAENAELDGELFELLVNISLDRMNDRSYQVRAQAAKASGRLQNTKDPDDLITKRLIWLMDHDSHPLVRKESLRSIAITRSNLPHFLRRLTDTNATVRLCAYNVFAQKVQTLKVLPTIERCRIVRMGMDDPEEPVVRAFVECVVHTWIDKLPVPPGTDLTHQPDAHKTITGFLKMIDVMNIGEQTGRILKMLFDDNLTKHYDHFKDTFINDKRLIGVEQLDCESAFFWQHLVEYLSRNNEYTEKLDAILPELVDLVDVIYDLIRSYHDDSSTDSVAAEINFVIDCALHVMAHCKFDDLAGRYRVETLCRDMLFMEEIAPTTYKMIMNIMKKIEPKFEHRQRKTIEMLADLEKRESRCTEHILADRKSEYEIIALRERQSSLQDSLHRIRDHDIASQNVDERVRLEKDLIEVKQRLSNYDHTILSTQSQSHMSTITSTGDRSSDDHRNFMIVKRLTILSELLSTTMPNKVLPPSFVTYARDLAVSNVLSFDLSVRRHAVRALGLLAVYDKQLMIDTLELINKVVENDSSIAVIEGLNALGDMFIRHNASSMLKNTNNTRQVMEALEQGFNLISRMIDNRTLNVRLAALTNMIKLFFVGQVNSAEAFAKLIVSWYDESTDIRVGGLLTTFFPAYADKFWQTDKYLFNSLEPSIEGLLKNDFTKQEPTFVADAIKLFLQLHQIRERAVIDHLMKNVPASSGDTTNVDLPDPTNDPNTTNLDLTIHAHLNSSIISVNKQALDKETVEKQKHEARLKYHFYVAHTILGQLKSSTNDDLIRSLITTLNLIDITTDDWTIIKSLRRKSKKVNKYLTVSKRKSNLKMFIKKLSNRVELLRGFDDDNDTTLNESTLTDSSQLNNTVISAVPAHVTNAVSTTPGSPLMDTVFRGLGKKKRLVKDSLLSQNSTSSVVVPPPPPPPPPIAIRSPLTLPPVKVSRNEKNATNVSATPTRQSTNNMDTSSCSSPSSSDNEDQTSDIENEKPQYLSHIISSANKRARADATSTESLSPPRTSVTNSNRMILRSSARRQPGQQSQQIPISTPSFRQQRKHRRIDLEITPLNNSNKNKLPPPQSSTPHTNQ